jgi:hypothetical protein
MVSGSHPGRAPGTEPQPTTSRARTRIRFKRSSFRNLRPRGRAPSSSSLGTDTFPKFSRYQEEDG